MEQTTDAQSRQALQCGIMFVKEYYGKMARNPEETAVMYARQSVLTISGRTEQTEEIRGVDAISKTLTDSAGDGFGGGHYTLSSLVTQPSVQDSCLIMAKGSVSARGVTRDFHQTFLLAKNYQTDGYYIHNDSLELSEKKSNGVPEVAHPKAPAQVPYRAEPTHRSPPRQRTPEPSPASVPQQQQLQDLSPRASPIRQRREPEGEPMHGGHEVPSQEPEEHLAEEQHQAPEEEQYEEEAAAVQEPAPVPEQEVPQAPAVPLEQHVPQEPQEAAEPIEEPAPEDDMHPDNHQEEVPEVPDPSPVAEVQQVPSPMQQRSPQRSPARSPYQSPARHQQPEPEPEEDLAPAVPSSWAGVAAQKASKGAQVRSAQQRVVGGRMPQASYDASRGRADEASPLPKSQQAGARRGASPTRQPSPTRRPPAPRGESRFQHPALYLSRLPAAVTKEDLEEIFGKFGKVVNSTLRRDDRKAFIDFSDRPSMERALAQAQGEGIWFHSEKLFVQERKSPQEREADRKRFEERQRRPGGRPPQQGN